MYHTTSGEGMEVLAQRELFAPLGITDWLWDVDPQGFAYGGHGLHLRTEDLAKIGLLFLNAGSWDGVQVVPESWVVEATTPRYGWGDSFGALEDLDYGYLWWTAEVNGHPAFLAWGWGGQFALCVPEMAVVIATAADGMVWSDEARIQELALLHLMVDEVLAAMRPLVVFSDAFEDGTTGQWTR